MAEVSEIDHKHRQSLERLEASHRNALIRQEQNEARRRAYAREAVIIEGENAEALMKLKHEFDRENRLLDHAFNQSEDAREVERLATEIAMRRRDDFIRHYWTMEKELCDLEAKIFGLLAEGIINERQSKLDHAHDMAAKIVDHANTIEVETHKTNEAIRLFEFQERLKDELSSEQQTHDEETIAKIVSTLKDDN